MTFERIPGSEGLINPHFTGVDLECINAGLEYRASAPYFDIRALRTKESDKFDIEFRGSRDSYPGIARAYLKAGRDLTSVEQCIIDAVNDLSRLKNASIPPPDSIFFRMKHKKHSFKNGSKVSITTRKTNSDWPDRPGPEESKEKYNVLAVKPGYLYRLVSRDYSIGVFRRSKTDNFSITFRRIDAPRGSRIRVRIMAGRSLDSIWEVVSKALSDPHNYLWKITPWHYD